MFHTNPESSLTQPREQATMLAAKHAAKHAANVSAADRGFAVKLQQRALYPRLEMDVTKWLAGLWQGDFEQPELTDKTVFLSADAALEQAQRYAAYHTQTKRITLTPKLVKVEKRNAVDRWKKLDPKEAENYRVGIVLDGRYMGGVDKLTTREAQGLFERFIERREPGVARWVEVGPVV